MAPIPKTPRRRRRYTMPLTPRRTPTTNRINRITPRGVIGRASGATLGFITNGVPGAVAGYRIGAYYADRTGNNLPENNSMANGSTRRRFRIRAKSVGGRKTIRRARRAARRLLGRKRSIKKRNYVVSSIGQDMDKVYVKPKMKVGKYKKSKMTFNYQVIKSRVYSASSGVQMVKAIDPMLTRTQLAGSTDNTVTSYRWPDDPFLLNPYHQVPSSTLYPGPHAQVVSNDTLHVLHVSETLNILNMTTVPAEIKVVWVQCRKDQPIALDPVTLWSNQSAADSLGIIQVPFRFGTATATIGTGFPNEGIPGDQPTEHRNWSQIWKIIASTTFILKEGEQKIVKQFFPVYKMFNRSFFETTAPSGPGVSDLEWLAGMTIVPILISRPGIVGIHDHAANTPSTEVAYGPNKIGVLYNRQFKFGAVPVQRFNLKRVQLATVTVQPNNVMRQIDEDDDVQDVDVN